MLCTQTPGGVHEDDYVQMLLDRGVAGIIYVSGQHADTTSDPERYTRLRERGLPIVLVNGYHEAIDAPFISNDDVASMELALTHLVQLGHTQIGLAVGPDRFVPVIRKIIGFRASMRSLLGRDDVEELDRAHPVLGRGWRHRGGPTPGEGVHGSGLRFGSHGPRCDPCGPPGRVAGARGLLGRRVRRLAADPVHGPAADDGAPERPGDVRGRGPGVARRDRRRAAPRAEFVFRPELVVRASTGAVPAR